jgi:hypothetical protein
MAITYKILGQLNPTANTLSTVYTVPASNSAVISSIVICNLGANATSFRLAAVPSGNNISTLHYMNFDTPIPGSDSIAITIGATLSANDSIRANVATGNISISIFGSEVY